MRFSSLRAYLDSVLLERPVGPSYEKALMHRIDAYSEHLGHLAKLDDLQSDSINRWVKAMEESGRYKPRTIRHFRNAPIFLWHQAFERGDLPQPPQRIRRVKVPEEIVWGWTLDDLAKLVAATRILRGHVPGTVIRKRDWMQAFIFVVHSTAIRRCDAMNHARTENLCGNVLRVVQQKTGYLVVRQLTRQAMDALTLVRHDGPYLLPWLGDVRRFYESFRRCVRKAGIRPGGTRRLRISSGSYFERDHPGEGGSFLGHRDPGIFRRCYNDQAISGRVPEPPPEIPAITQSRPVTPPEL